MHFLRRGQTLFLFFKTICATNVLEKIVWGKSCHEACTDVMRIVPLTQSHHDALTS